MPLSFASDEALIAGCLEGKKEAWDQFVEKFSRLIYWGIRQTLSGSGFAARHELGDEVFQEIFQRLIERGELARLRQVKSVRKFLTVMACRMTLNKVRSLSRFEKKVLPFESEDILGEGIGPSCDAGEKEKESLVAEIIATLPSREQAALELFYLSGKSYEEISLILGLPQTTVANLLWRTKQKLKVRFTEKGLGEGL